jgi:sec-independent protein translocase protein TatB
MFDVGWSEMVVIAVVALIVLGPERLPKAARLAGLWVRRARAQWYSVKAELESELAAEDLKQQLRTPVDELHRQLRAPLNEVKQAVDDLGHDAAPPPPPPRPDPRDDAP